MSPYCLNNETVPLQIHLLQPVPSFFAFTFYRFIIIMFCAAFWHKKRLIYYSSVIKLVSLMFYKFC